MAPRSFRHFLFVATLVGLTCLGLVVTSSGTAQALERGPADRLAFKLLGRGVAAAGVATASPEVIAKQEAKCVRGGPGYVGCLAATTGALFLAFGAYETRDWWMPWAEDFFTGGGGEGPQNSSCFDAVGLDTSKPCIGMVKLSFGALPTTVAGGGYTLSTSEWVTTPNEVVSMTEHYVCSNGYQDNNGLTVVMSEGPRSYVRSGFCSGALGGLKQLDVTGLVVNHNNNYTSTKNNIHWTAPTSAPTSATANLTCKNTSTGATQVISYTDAPWDASVHIPSCPAGWQPTNLGVTVGTKTSSVDMNPSPNEAFKYPQCVAAECLYRIFVDGNPCAEGAPDCVHWTQVQKADPAAVRCYYGPYVVAIELCRFMERAYDPKTGARTITGPNVDGDPATKTDPLPDPNPSPRPTPTAGSTPSPTPTAKTPAEECLNGAPGCAPKTDPNDPTGKDDCWPSGWGAVNPANWVLQPLKCAARWAFIPPAGAYAAGQAAVGGAYTASTMGKWSVALPTIWDSLGSAAGGQGCQGPRVPTGVVGVGTGIGPAIYPFDACSGPVQKAAQVSYALSSFSVAFFGGLKCLNVLGTAFGFAPSIAHQASNLGKSGDDK